MQLLVTDGERRWILRYFAHVQGQDDIATELRYPVIIGRDCQLIQYRKIRSQPGIGPKAVYYLVLVDLTAVESLDQRHQSIIFIQSEDVSRLGLAI